MLLKPRERRCVTAALFARERRSVTAAMFARERRSVTAALFCSVVVVDVVVVVVVVVVRQVPALSSTYIYGLYCTHKRAACCISWSPSPWLLSRASASPLGFGPLGRETVDWRGLSSLSGSRLPVVAWLVPFSAIVSPVGSRPCGGETLAGRVLSSLVCSGSPGQPAHVCTVLYCFKVLHVSS